MFKERIFKVNVRSGLLWNELGEVAESLLPVYNLTREGVVVDTLSLLCMGIDHCERPFG